MSKHTPGPWEVRKPILRGKYRGDFAVGPKSHEGYNQDPVFCHLAKGRDDIQAANAAIIAAAPDMLEQLHLIVANLADIDSIKAVIAKAEGRT